MLTLPTLPTYQPTELDIRVVKEPWPRLFDDEPREHQRKLSPSANKFHVGNGSDGKHYWLTPPDLYAALHAEFQFDFDPCPYPVPEGFDGLTCEWGQSNYVNPPFGSIIHQGRKKGPTAWMRKAIAEHAKGKRVVIVYPVDKWILMLLKAAGVNASVRNLGDVKWCATEDGSPGKGTGRHIACFILDHQEPTDIAKELDRAHRERTAAKAKGFWPVVQGCDRVIETLRRLQVTAPTQKAVGMVAAERER